MSTFTVHWSIVSGEQVRQKAPQGFLLLAIWPSPVNHDSCFRDAGFTDFGDNDSDWDNHAEQLLVTLLDELSKRGSPRLMSKPIALDVRSFERFLRKSEPLGLREQIRLPICWDSLPECIVAFGDGGATLRAGNGHYLFWLTLPLSEVDLEGLGASHIV